MTAVATEPLHALPADFAELEEFRSELRGYCYRMLGSIFDADDAVQETLVKAWRKRDGFEGRSSLRSWLYRIATNVCLDSLRSKGRRAMPMDLSSPVSASNPPGATTGHEEWVEPAPADDVVPTDPAQHAVLQESVRLAFVAALQHLPPRQRAVLILREVLCWQAAEVAELLESSVAAVNSALQRARATLGSIDVSEGPPLTADDRALLARYVSAFESYDIASLVQLLHEDASISMPPYPMWLQGTKDLHDWYLGYGAPCRGSRLVQVSDTVFGQYRVDPAGGHSPWSLQVIELSEGRIRHVHHFLDARLFARFGLPKHL